MEPMSSKEMPFDVAEDGTVQVMGANYRPATEDDIQDIEVPDGSWVCITGGESDSDIFLCPPSDEDVYKTWFLLEIHYKSDGDETVQTIFTLSLYMKY